MEQFSLEKYLADPTRKVVTRDGRDVRIICTDKKTNKGYPIVALVLDGNIDVAEIPAAYTERGEYSGFGDDESDMDLFFAPRKQSRWVFLWHSRFTDRIEVSNPFNKFVDAELAMETRNGFGLTEITWED